MSDTHAGRLEQPAAAADRSGLPGALLSVPGLTLLLSVAGAAIAGYLTYSHFDESALVCSANGGCHTVQESSYATIGPVPIAVLGLGMFLTLGGLALIQMLGSKLLSSDTVTLATWGITLSALLYYAYLVYVELFVLEAICQWCVGTTVITIAIFVIHSFGLRSALEIDDAEFAELAE